MHACKSGAMENKTEVPYQDLKLSVGSTRLMPLRTTYFTMVKSTILETQNLDAGKKSRFYKADFIYFNKVHEPRSNIPCLQQMSSFYPNTSKTAVFPDYKTIVLRYSAK